MNKRFVCIFAFGIGLLSYCIFVSERQTIRVVADRSTVISHALEDYRNSTGGKYCDSLCKLIPYLPNGKLPLNLLTGKIGIAEISESDATKLLHGQIPFQPAQLYFAPCKNGSILIIGSRNDNRERSWQKYAYRDSLKIR